MNTKYIGEALMGVNESANALVEEVRAKGRDGHVSPGEQAIAMGLAIVANGIVSLGFAVLSAAAPHVVDVTIGEKPS